MDPVDVAWVILKAAFQPAEGVQIGAGMNQTVFGRPDSPDVVKVSDLAKRPQQLDAMYYNELLSRMPLGLFAGQVPIEQTAQLPEELGPMSLPVLSMQGRGQALPGSPRGLDADTKRGREIQAALHAGVPLLEAMNLMDLKPQNWMIHHSAGPIMTDHSVQHRDMGSGPGARPVVIHDPDFGEAGVFRPRAGVGRRQPGVDFEVPEYSLSLLARRADELPFEQFVEPIEESYDKFHEGRGYDALQDRLAQRERAINRMFSHIGIGG